MESLEYLFAAYAITWIAISVYLYSLARRQAALREEIEVLEDALKITAEKER